MTELLLGSGALVLATGCRKKGEASRAESPRAPRSNGDPGPSAIAHGSSGRLVAARKEVGLDAALGSTAANSATALELLQ